jgi:hypothetical protein
MLTIRYDLVMYPKRRIHWFVHVAFLGIAAASGAAQENRATLSSPNPAATSNAKFSAAGVEVAPGIPLPANGMVWILDQKENEPRLSRIRLNSAHINGHRAENFVRAQFLVLKMGSSVELLGMAAKARVDSHTPAIFVRKSEEAEEEAQSAVNPTSVQEHYVLLHAQVADDHRVLCTFTAWQLGLKLTPKQPIPDGEYAVVHMPDSKKMFETNSYDFGVGPVSLKPVKSVKP